MLFRFSAVTFNSHRIHYDRTYAAAEEGYPALVVHAPLVAMLLLQLLRKNSEKHIRRFEYRALAPLFDGQPVSSYCCSRRSRYHQHAGASHRRKNCCAGQLSRLIKL